MANVGYCTPDATAMNAGSVVISLPALRVEISRTSDLRSSKINFRFFFVEKKRTAKDIDDADFLSENPEFREIFERAVRQIVCR